MRQDNSVQIKSSWVWLQILILGGIFVIGLVLNHITLHRLPIGEDEMYYIGTIRRMFDFNISRASWASILAHPQNKFFLFYTVGWIWSGLGRGLNFFTYFNLVYIFFYFLAFISFIRLTTLRSSDFIFKLIGALLFILLPSSTIWLGPAYFVPSFWLYISYPNLVASGLQKRWLELAFWILINYFFYWYGFELGLVVGLIAVIFAVARNKPLWFNLIILGLMGLIYRLIGIKYINSFILALPSAFDPKINISILPFLFWVYLIGSIFAFIYILLSQDKKTRSLWFVLVVLGGLFYLITRKYPTEMAGYRLVPIFYVGLGLLATFLPNLKWLQSSKTIYKLISLIGLIFLIVVLVKLCQWSRQQDSGDTHHLPITTQEVKIFTEADQTCRAKKCLVVTDAGTYTVGQYYAPRLFPDLAQYDRDSLVQASLGPVALKKYAQEKHANEIILIVSKRTSQLYDVSITSPNIQISRSYNDDNQSPLIEFDWLKQYRNYLSDSYAKIGLYRYQIPIK